MKRKLRLSRIGLEQLEQRQLLATIKATVLVDDFLAQPLPSEVGREFSFYNRIGGDRGEVANEGRGEVTWGDGFVEARVLREFEFAGVSESLNQVVREGRSLDLNAIFPTQIPKRLQYRATTVLIRLADGEGPFKVELRSPSNELLWSKTRTLSGGPRLLRFPLPNPAPTDAQKLVWIVERQVDSFAKVTNVSLNVEGPDLGPLEPFVWTYANLLALHNPESGLTKDRANFPSGDFDNISASGGQALAAVSAQRLGVISKAAARQIVNQVTSGVSSVPTIGGVLPHFTRGRNNPTLAPDTEYSSLDTTIALLGILLARQSLNLPTGPAENMIRAIDWQALTLPNGTISHGYDSSGALLENGWDTFGGESFLAIWAYAAALPNDSLPALPFPSPPTHDGSGFIDELASLFFPMPRIDVWGNDWPSYRAEAVERQLNHYEAAPGEICCASAGEVPEPWEVDEKQIYQALGIGGRTPPKDGTELIGHLVATPHYAGMIASLQPAAARKVWDYLVSSGAKSPLNIVESLFVDGNRPVWNPLKGGWNLFLASQGYAKSLLGEAKFPAYQAARQNAFARNGLARLTTERTVYATDVVLDSVAARSKSVHLKYEIVGDGSAPFQLSLVRSRNQKIDLTDAQLDTILISDPVDLTPGEHHKSFDIGSNANSVKLPGAGALDSNNYYRIYAVADPANRIKETNENNNTAQFSGAYLGQNAVYVHGTNADNDLTILDAENTTRVGVSLGNATQTVTFPRAAISALNIRTHDGNDTVDGRAVETTRLPMNVWAGKGNDILRGGQADDLLVGGSGNDFLLGRNGNDRLLGAGGEDQLRGGGGDDNLAGAASSDVLDGGKGDDLLKGGSLDDLLFGGLGNDLLFGGPGADQLFGGALSALPPTEDDQEDDLLHGGSNRDTGFVASTSGDSLVAIERTIVFDN